MAVQRITKRVVEALNPADSDTFIWDADVRGFGLKVTPSGKKVYVIQYRLPGLGRSGSAAARPHLTVWLRSADNTVREIEGR